MFLDYMRIHLKSEYGEVGDIEGLEGVLQKLDVDMTREYLEGIKDIKIDIEGKFGISKELEPEAWGNIYREKASQKHRGVLRSIKPRLIGFIGESKGTGVGK
jgi:hypothetical protein